MKDTVKKTLGLLSAEDKRALWLLLLVSLISGLLEVVGIASVAPFLTVVANPGTIHSNAALGWAYEHFGFHTQHGFLIALGALTLATVVISNSFVALTTWLTIRFAENRGYTMARRLLHGYLHMPYRFFLQRTSSELGKNVLDEVSRVVRGVILPGIRLAVKAPVILLIAVTLFIANPRLSLATIVIFGGAYAGSFGFSAPGWWGWAASGSRSTGPDIVRPTKR